MLHSLKRYISASILLGIIATIIVSCANMASPSGGDYDFDPPKVVRTSPGFNATNVKSGKIVIEFDENVTIERPSENVIITPPQKSFPSITTVNRKVVIELRDPLLPNTTYTIDFTNSIADNNEKNPIENFSYSFSTGDIVDSLAISGKVLEANNLEPIKGMYVGLHSNLNDTAFTKTKFERISRTNESGLFTIRGVAPGKYRLYALNDANRDYMYDNPAEAIAFFDTTVEPASEKATRNDTTFVDKDKKIVDTIKAMEYTRFLPDNIVLRSFKSNFQRQFLQKHERVQNKVALYFGAPTEMPKIEPLNFDKDKDWYVLEKTLKNDTLIYWIKDKDVMAIDTLAFKVTYLKTDSLNQAIPITDTLNFTDRTRRPVKEEKKKEKKGKNDNEEPEITFLKIENNLSSTWDTHNNISLLFDEPIITDSLSNKIRLKQLKDSVYNDVPLILEVDSLNPRKYTIKNRWKYDEEFQLEIDSASIYSIYGLWNDRLEQKFKVKSEDQYGQLAIWVAGVDTITSFIELLDKSDKPIRKSKVKDRVAVFKDVAPGTYYARIILDENNNGMWDTGDYSQKKQPEMVCYSPKVFEIKAFFEHEEQDPWVIDPSTLADQKPLEITKQKPAEKESRKKQMEEKEEKENQQNRRNNNSRDRDQNRNSNRGNSQYGSQNMNNQYGGQY
ncbi:Ig-like domain-containing protein [Dysgonomonas sp. Marseille-P4677]|uniref:Ig-like domain-containing protein n=1 Tax=Dysgonomonas sp. Marseille-P4677 TaxID=2364790 RepID=UPI00191492FC|nr:Ig-like domain-containing protein [Dysgonomonas sp. Marseille-P4677]MBK5721086.1 Ig-like domain-containing protein [Dysgonomonas sp. Marseille-P4677]